MRFYHRRFKNRKINRAFKKNNPEVVLPPDYIIYESFDINYAAYYNQSVDSAKWLISFFKRYIDLKKIRILDWGCGPGRVIRHFPDLINNNCDFFGTDYNKISIDWCKKNIPNVQFSLNKLEPPLEYDDRFFDIIYGLSVLTHLLEKMHYLWFKELCRVIKQGGIIYLTTQGEAFRLKLTLKEIEKFDKGEIVVRSKTKEGHRTFSAFQPERFMYNLFSEVEILEHIKRKPDNKFITQEIWIIKKK